MRADFGNRLAWAAPAAMPTGGGRSLGQGGGAPPATCGQPQPGGRAVVAEPVAEARDGGCGDR
ncbi:hypothetical protein GCM10009634_34890 [Saccharothrix xinjiangensis]